MNRAAIGVRMHSGWGALVAVSHQAGKVEVIDRRRITLTPPGAPGAIQPYHFAKDLALPAAEKFIGDCFAASKNLAAVAIQDLVNELRTRKYRVVASAVILASGRPLPPLAKILAAHPLLHAAEGEFFREAFTKACENLNIPVAGIRQRDLEDQARKKFRKSAPRIAQQITAAGRSLGSPWTTDQKTATLAALLALM
ncbi:MAG TPA: hypothetical protein VIH76_13450 [Candidatus Acidoferrales bacterium]